MDALAAHFGATAWLMKLWLRQGAEIVFVSHGCDPSSGQHSVSVLIPKTARAREAKGGVVGRVRWWVGWWVGTKGNEVVKGKGERVERPDDQIR